MSHYDPSAAVIRFRPKPSPSSHAAAEGLAALGSFMRGLGDAADTCPRCGHYDCTPECIAAEEAEMNKPHPWPTPRKFA